MHWPLTEGVKRAIRQAANLAQLANVADIELLHLLWALILDESRAAELLERHGITRATIAEDLPVWHDVPAIKLNDPVQRGEIAEIVDRHYELQAVLWEADGRRKRLHTGEDLNSEHLLWALISLASPAAEFLSQHGVNRDVFVDTSPTAGEPLAVDFEIAWEAQQAVSGSEPAPVCNSPENSLPGSDNATWRTLDAAANRAREGLRVIEDYTRFQLNDAHLSRRLKECRHRLAAALAEFEPQYLIAMRDTPGDVGTRISTESESQRQSALDVVQANFKRTEEAVRSLEEFGKTLSVRAACECEAVRYELYTLEKAVLTTATNRDRLADCRLYLLLTRELCECEPEETLCAAIAGGVHIVQIREKSMTDRELLAWCRRAREVAKGEELMAKGSEPRAEGGDHRLRPGRTTKAESGKRKAEQDPAEDSALRSRPSALRPPLFIINDRPDIAVLCDADGVHVGQEELSVAEARRIVGPDKLVGVSTHTIEQARQAVLDGADYIGVGPVFPSKTKAFEEFAGLELVKQVAAEITLPWFAIGGVGESNISEVLEAGASRVAVSGAMCGSNQPQTAAVRLMEMLPP